MRRSFWAYRTRRYSTSGLYILGNATAALDGNDLGGDVAFATAFGAQVGGGTLAGPTEGWLTKIWLIEAVCWATPLTLSGLASVSSDLGASNWGSGAGEAAADACFLESTCINTRSRRVVVAASRTASNECPPSRVMRSRERTCKYPCPNGPTRLSSLSLFASIERRPTPLGENRIASPVRSLTICTVHLSNFILEADVFKPCQRAHPKATLSLRRGWIAASANWETRIYAQ